ncbi:MAG TPA: DUF1992 domain-containing protein [Humisphaera sp.]
MALKDMDIGAVLQRLADRKIEQAMREGKFDNLEGAGKPLDLEPIPAEENARLRWWALRILKQNDVTPDEVRWRKQADGLREQLERTTSEPRVRALVAAINDLARRVNTLGTNAINLPVAPASLDEELAKLKGRVRAMELAAEEVAKAEAAKPSRAVPSPDGPRPAGLPHKGFFATLFGAAVRTCTDERCGTRNPGKAKFCRRCGGTLA